MLSATLYILIFIAVLTVLVLIHEAGHFFVAKAAKVKVLEFGLGFPPRIWGIRRGETLYSVNAIPLGGFVKMLGEEDPTEPGSLAGKSTGVRFLVMAAGPFMNAVLAVVLFSFLFMIPQDVVVGQVIVREVSHNLPAKEAGIQPGDIIIEANGQALDNHNDLIYLANLKLGTRMTWMIQREDQRFPVEVTLQFNPPEDLEDVDVLVGEVVIQEVQNGSPAQEAGIQAGDVIVEAAGQVLDNHTHLVYLVDLNLGTAMSWIIQREGQRLPVKVTPRLNPPQGQGPVGILVTTVDVHVEKRSNPPWSALNNRFASIEKAGVALATVNSQIESRSSPPWTAVRKGVERVGEVPVLIKNAFMEWASGGEQPFAGPVGVGQVFVEVGQAEGIALADRLLFILQLAALLSVLLDIFNILPIPALDGGRILFVAIEWVRRGKKISPEKEGFVHLVGFVALITFLLFITFFVDIQRIIRGESLLGG